MEVTRGRWRDLVEWTVAVALLFGGVAVGVAITGQLERVVPGTPVSARQPGAPSAPASVPARAVSVPILELGNDIRIQVGDAAADIFPQLVGLVVAGANSTERLAGGERVTREFLHTGGRFHLITESRAEGARVTAIFVVRSTDR